MAELGSFVLLLALALSGYSFLAGLVALVIKHPGAYRLGETARRAGVATFGAVVLGALVLVVSAFRNDFSLAYILHHSNRDLPWPYKFATLWSRQEGSLLFWSLLLSTYGLVLRLRHKTDERLFAHASVIIAVVQVFFFLLLNFAAKPFALMQGQLPADGNGLTPLLQYPEMVIHPPILYLGYVGFTVPFAFAMASLINRQRGEEWIYTTRRWSLVTWFFQSAGILLGAGWAYAVLGWGGYWGWDPVENASLLPWLTSTAFLHSVMMQEKKGMMKIWNMVLVAATFFLCIFGTTLTRTGLVSSVHAFAQSPIGAYFFGFLGLGIAGTVYLILDRLDYLKSESQMESVVSRESSFLFNNLILLASCFSVLWGTLFPVISEWVSGDKISLDADWYNRLMVPIGLFLLLLTGVGPLFAWRRTSVESLRRNFQMPGIAMLVLVIALAAAGMRHPYALVSFGLCLFVALTVAQEFYKGARSISAKNEMNFARAVVELTHRNTRRYGGYLVHMGIVLVFIGFPGHAFNHDEVKEINPGDLMKIGTYTIRNVHLAQDAERHFSFHRGTTAVAKAVEPLGV